MRPGTVLVFVAALAGVFGSTQPTGTWLVDAVWRALAALGFGFGLRSVTPGSRRLALVLLAPFATIPVGAVALVVALVSTVTKDSYAAPAGKPTRMERRSHRRWAVMSSRQAVVVSGAAVAALFNLTDRWMVGSAAVSAAASLAVVIIGSIVALPSRQRRRVAGLCAAPLLATVAIGVLYTLQMAGHAPGLAKAAQQLADDPAEVDRSAFAGRLDRASTTADRWYFRPLEAIPVGAQNLRATRHLLGAADDIIDASQIGDLADRTGDSSREGAQPSSIDVDACAGMETLVRQIEAPEPLLVPPLRRALEKMDPHQDLITRGARLCPVVPHLSTLAGFDGDRSHLVLFATTAESRGTIGLVTNWARISASEGSFALEDSGRSVPLNDLLAERGATVDLPPGSDGLWGRFDPAKYFQDVSLSPSAPVVADAAADLYAQAFPAHPPDGVLIIGPQAIAAVVGLCSGVEAGDVDLDEGSTVDFLTRDQYTMDLSYGERVAMLQTILDSLFGKMSSGGCSATPEGLIGVLDAVSAGEVLYVPQEQPMRADFLSTALGGDLPVRADGELFGVIEQNAGLDKLDAYLTRESTLTWPDRSSSTPQLRLTYVNDAPEELPEYVLGLDHGDAPARVNRRRVSIYAPVIISEVSTGTIDADVRSVLVPYRGREGGHWVTTFLVDIAPDNTTVVVIDFEDWNAPSEELTILRPPALRAGDITVVVGDQEQTVPLGRRISRLKVS